MTVSKFASMCGIKKITPDVKKAMKTAMQYRQEVRKIHTKLKIFKKQKCNMKKLSYNLIDHVDEMMVSSKLRLLLRAELRNMKCKPRGRSWTLEDKLFALAIFKRSARAYRFLRGYIMLPSESTLKSVLQSVNLEPGICPPLLNALKCKVSKMKAKDKNCVVLFDETFLAGGLYFNEKKGSVDGFDDYGERGRTTMVGDHALVFMVQGIGGLKWTQPVAYYFVHKTCPSHMLKLLIIDVVKALFNIGLNVLGTVSDQGPTNRGAISELRSNSPLNDDIIYSIDGHNLVHIFDIPHAMKNVRNNLLSSNLEFRRGAIANFRHIIEYLKVDESMCSVSSLSEKHLNPQGKLKMRVKYAVETLSSRVAAQMETFCRLSANSDNPVLVGCMDTVEFLRLVDLLFDLTNGPSASEKRPKDTRCNVSKNSLHHEPWPKMIKKNWKTGLT